MGLTRGPIAAAWRPPWALLVALCMLCLAPWARAAIAQADPATQPDPAGRPDSNIHLKISPRICTLTAADKECVTPVHAQWRSAHNESLCLVIVTRPDVKRCWEHFAAGTYTIDLTFSQDLTFQLRDVSLERVFASEVLRVIREALLYRHKRRQPWNIFD